MQSTGTTGNRKHAEANQGYGRQRLETKHEPIWLSFASVNEDDVKGTKPTQIHRPARQLSGGGNREGTLFAAAQPTPDKAPPASSGTKLFRV